MICFTSGISKSLEKKMTKSISAFTWKDAMKYRYEIFGVAAIWILFFHIRERIGGSLFFPLKIIFMVVSKGNIGVDIFLFLSAIGLCASIQKNRISDFYTNRLKRVLIPYLIISIPYFVWFNFFHTSNGFVSFLGDVTTVNYWLRGDHPIWYVAFIMIMYALFPLIYRLDVKTRHISTVCLTVMSVVCEYLLYRADSWLYNNAERALSRVPIFLVGILIAPRVLRGAKIALWKVALACIVGGGLFVLICIKPLDIVLTRYIYGVISICAVILYGFVRNLIDIKILARMLAWLGGISFEIYVVHVLIVRVIRYNDWWGAMPKVFWYILIPVVSLPLAKCVSIICSYISTKRRSNAAENVVAK